VKSVRLALGAAILEIVKTVGEILVKPQEGFVKSGHEPVGGSAETFQKLVPLQHL
jgi:hypothetical protein